MRALPDFCFCSSRYPRIDYSVTSCPCINMDAYSGDISEITTSLKKCVYVTALVRIRDHSNLTSLPVIRGR